MTGLLIPPLVSSDRIDIDHFNRCLVDWGHKMGPLNRPCRVWTYGLFHDGKAVAVAAAADLIRERVAGFDRAQAIELARVCASRPDLCRIIIRLWREFVFPDLRSTHGFMWALSYQDRAQHSGNLYRFDGWVRMGVSRSGTDQRTGRRGRNKTIWGWHPDARIRQARREMA